MGGSNDPTNITRLTRAQHAEAHRVLWECHHKREDLWAWKFLARDADGMREALALYWTPEQRKVQAEKAKEQMLRFNIGSVRRWADMRTDANPMKSLRTNAGSFQCGHTPADSAEIRNKKRLSKLGNRNPNFQKSGQWDRINNTKRTCEHCGQSFTLGNYTRWHGSKCKHNPIIQGFVSPVKHYVRAGARGTN
jgi:hypothetical protein